MKEIEINGGSLEIGQRTNWLFCANQASLLDENATILKP
jgi:hypothetical protein